MTQTNGRCYEDFEVGLVMRHALGRTITSADNIWFTLLTIVMITALGWLMRRALRPISAAISGSERTRAKIALISAGVSPK
jgi:hypothetical protein